MTLFCQFPLLVLVLKTLANGGPGTPDSFALVWIMKSNFVLTQLSFVSGQQSKLLVYTETYTYLHLFWGSSLLTLFFFFLLKVVVVAAKPTEGGYEAW